MRGLLSYVLEDLNMNVFRVRLCEEDIKKLSERANELGLATSTLVRMWISEGLNRTDSSLFITQVVRQAMSEVTPKIINEIRAGRDQKIWT